MRGRVVFEFPREAVGAGIGWSRGTSSNGGVAGVVERRAVSTTRFESRKPHIPTFWQAAFGRPGGGGGGTAVVQVPPMARRRRATRGCRGVAEVVVGVHLLHVVTMCGDRSVWGARGVALYYRRAYTKLMGRTLNSAVFEAIAKGVASRMETPFLPLSLLPHKQPPPPRFSADGSLIRASLHRFPATEVIRSKPPRKEARLPRRELAVALMHQYG